MLNERLTARIVAIASREKSISCAVWFYYRFAVNFRDVEEAMASRGVVNGACPPSTTRWRLCSSGVPRARNNGIWELSNCVMKSSRPFTISVGARDPGAKLNGSTSRG